MSRMGSRHKNTRGPLPEREKVRKLVDPLWLCCDESGTAYLTIPRGQGSQERQEVHPLRSSTCQSLMRRLYLEEYEKAPSAQGFKEALDALEAQALKAVVPVGLRTMSYEDGFAVDLGDETWNRVIVRPGAWRLVKEGPLLRRGVGARPLPRPVGGGDLRKLRKFLNVQNDADFSLILGWLLYALQPRGPYPILILQGEQGSSKSTVARMLVSLVDPNDVPLVPIPRDNRELMIIARSRHIIALDNLSRIDTPLKDALCRLATGSGHIARKLYSDDEAVAWKACRPIILNGIDNLLLADDLTDRAISITLPPIPDQCRLPETDIWKEFSRIRFEMLGALLDAAGSALEAPVSLEGSHLPRMADFARFAASAAPAWGDSPEEWLEYYAGNRQGAIERGLDGDPIVQALRSLLEAKREWMGTSGELLQLVTDSFDSSSIKTPSCPNSPRALSDQLRRLAPALRAVGIEIRDLGRKKRGYTWLLKSREPGGDVHGERGEHSPLLNLEEEKKKRWGLAAGSPSSPSSPFASRLSSGDDR